MASGDPLLEGDGWTPLGFMGASATIVNGFADLPTFQSNDSERSTATFN